MPLQRERRVTAYLSEDEYHNDYLPLAARLRRTGWTFSAWLRQQLKQQRGREVDSRPLLSDDREEDDNATDSGD